MELSFDRLTLQFTAPWTLFDVPGALAVTAVRPDTEVCGFRFSVVLHKAVADGTADERRILDSQQLLDNVPGGLIVDSYVSSGGYTIVAARPGPVPVTCYHWCFVALGETVYATYSLATGGVGTGLDESESIAAGIRWSE